MTPIPHWLRKRFNMGIYRLSFLYGLGPKGYHSFMSGTSTYMPTAQPHTRAARASPRPSRAGLRCGCDLAKPYPFNRREFRMVTVRKVTKRSINTKVHCHSSFITNSVIQWSALIFQHLESTQHSLVRWTDRLEYYFYMCEDHYIL